MIFQGEGENWDETMIIWTNCQTCNTNARHATPIPGTPFNFNYTFGGLSDVQIGPTIACWKSPPVYFPEHIEFFHLEFIFIVKIQLSQHFSVHSA